MKTETEGLILTEQTVGDNDRLVTVLTKDQGVLRCFARGAKKMKNKISSSTQTLCYSRLSLFHGKDSYIIDEAEPLKVFTAVRKDIELLALAQYFCELVIYSVPEQVDSSEQLSLLLNCLHILTDGTKPPLFIKTVFELRIMMTLGYYPDILYCSGCGCYEADIMYFDVINNRLLCSSCSEEGNGLYGLSKGALTALRYLSVSMPKRIFSFQLSGESLRQLSECSEAFVLRRFKQPFSALGFYKQVRTE